jgi:hypothetical protein
MRALDALRQAVAQDREREIRASISGETPDAGDSFGLEQQSFIREWFSRQGPRAQQGERVTPSLERDEILPAELRQRFQPLPFALERQLPILARNLRRGIIVGDVVLLDEETSRIVDLIHGVLK